MDIIGFLVTLFGLALICSANPVGILVLTWGSLRLWYTYS